MNYKKMTALCVTSLLALGQVACGNATNQGSVAPTDSTSSVASNNESSGGTDQTIAVPSVTSLLDQTELFTERDMNTDIDLSGACSITLKNNESSCDSENVTILGNTITITKEGTYLISGSLLDGQIVVDAKDEKVQLVLSDTSITSQSSAAIYVKQADKVFLTLADGSTNTITAAGEFIAIDENEIDAAIFSKSDLTINGSGSLAVSCKYGHGIVSKDDLKITGGTYNVFANGHAINGKDSVRILSGDFTLSATKDGIHSENKKDESKGYIYIADGTFTITSDGDGIDASYILQIDGGSFTIVSGGDGVHADKDLVILGGDLSVLESYEGLEGLTITIYDGNISIVASDDGLNAAGGNDASGFGAFGGGMEYSAENQIIINGGTLSICAEGDGIDSNGDLIINAGTIYVDGPSVSANAPLDWGGSGIINGGTLLAAGAGGMAESFSENCTQGAILYSLPASTTGEITLSDANGNQLLSYTPSKSYSCVMLSCVAIEAGNTYTLTCGSNAYTIEMDSLTYGEGEGFGGFGGGFGGGGNRGEFGKPGDNGNRGGFGNPPEKPSGFFD